jgi:formylglycine-generating enzyme required for sulfatase activity
MVGQKIPNAWGVYDMQGKVWEWCKDVYIDYKEKGKITVHLNNNKYVIRGGSWINNSSYCRSTTRLCDYYSFYSNILGFRVAIVSIG